LTQPRLKFTVDEYMTVPPPERRFQLLDGEMILVPSPTSKHQRISLILSLALHQFVSLHCLGEVWYAPLDVILSICDVVQPDILFVSNERADIVTEANIQGAPDLVVEILSPSTARYDLGYKRVLYSEKGVLEYWIVDPEAETIEVMAAGDRGLATHALYHRGDTLTSPLLEGLSINLEQVFG
jgi:Uma2 family endonuclease